MKIYTISKYFEDRMYKDMEKFNVINHSYISSIQIWGSESLFVKYYDGTSLLCGFKLKGDEIRLLVRLYDDTKQRYRIRCEQIKVRK